MAALTWTTLRTALVVALSKAQPPYNVIPVDFLELYPQATSYAEGRIYRDLVLLATREQDVSLLTVAGNRTLDISQMDQPVIVPEGVALLTPAGSTLTNGTREPFDLSSLDVIDMTWPDQSVTLNPAKADWLGRRWALLDDHTVVIAPTPDDAYTVVVTGLFQPAPISAITPVTYLSNQYPDLLTAACMIFLTGALTHNFGAQADEPRSAVSWEQQYQALKASAMEEEMRRRGLTPDVAATPQNTPGAAR